MVTLDSSKISLKWLLLYNEKKTYTPVPFAHSVHLKESYQNLANVLEKIKWNEYYRLIYGKLKVMWEILDQQLGYTKFSFVNGSAELRIYIGLRKNVQIENIYKLVPKTSSKLTW